MVLGTFRALSGGALACSSEVSAFAEARRYGKRALL